MQNQSISFERTAASEKSLPCKLLQSENLEWFRECILASQVALGNRCGREWYFVQRDGDRVSALSFCLY